ncbi:hypothetical protein EVAR_23708_1 [Eumeta japonica]|uniref:Uncharacterized protein n=1 Tax=Eumeta variegata TaxID=151549 RepID=A0A4C1VGB3_EUMVA|nr:hypothetical protein EVAR_23708_1 [Eumeta japonica]
MEEGSGPPELSLTERNQTVEAAISHPYSENEIFSKKRANVLLEATPKVYRIALIKYGYRERLPSYVNV